MSEEMIEEPQQDPIKIALITGYLGAGKTTLLNHILTNTDGVRAAVIVNDIGEVNIDAELIAQTGAVTQMDDSLIPMTNGCICCTLSDDLARQLRSIADSGNFDYIIIEASGICDPMPIAYTIQAYCESPYIIPEPGYDEGMTEEELAELEFDPDPDCPPMALDNVIAVVDCARMFDEFNGGQDLLSEEVEEDDIEALLIAQIEFCSTLILNKVDQVSAEQLEELKLLVRNLQRSAKIIEAEQGRVDLNELLNTGLFDFTTVLDSAGWIGAMDADPQEEEEHHHHHHHDHDHDHDHECECGHDHDHDEECEDPDCECHHHHHHDHDGHCSCGHDHSDGHDHVAEFGISTFIYERRKPIAFESLQKVAKNWPDSVIRCKGMVWIEDNPDVCVIFEQAGHRFYLSENGPWLCTAEEEERADILGSNPHAMDGWDEEIGDRRIKLVFIGKNMNREEAEALFDSYLEV